MKGRKNSNYCPSCNERRLVYGFVENERWCSECGIRQTLFSEGWKTIESWNRKEVERAAAAKKERVRLRVVYERA